MSRRGVLALLALTPAALWVTQIVVGLGLAERACRNPTTLHLGGAVLLGAALATVSLAVRLRSRDSDAEGLVEIVSRVPIRVGVLFTVGIALSWTLGWFWPCP